MLQDALDKDYLIKYLQSNDAVQVEILLQNKTILDLHDYRLSSKEALIINKVLESNKTITSISLNIDNEGLAYICSLLYNNQHIVCINLNNGGITDDGAKYLAESLEITYIVNPNKVLCIDLSNNSISPVGKKALDKVIKDSKAPSPPEIIVSLKIESEHSKRINREKNQQLEKFKVVIFIGSGLPEASKAFESNVESRLNTVKIIDGTFDRNSMDDIIESPKTFTALDGRTDENTVFVIFAHGENKGNSHFIDDIPTDKFLNQLKGMLKHHINAVLFSCHGGGVLKTGKINDGISLVVAASSKYPISSDQCIDSILKILQWPSKDKHSLSAQELCGRLLLENVETCYYHNREKTIKFPIVAKFNLEEISNLLQSSKFDLEQQKKIGVALNHDLIEKNKISFSLSAIKNKIHTLGFDEELCNHFMKQLEMKWREKIAPENLKMFMKNRGAAEFKSQGSTTQLSSDVMFHTLNMAIIRGDIALFCAMMAYYPDLLNKATPFTGMTPLHCAAGLGNLEIVMFLLDKKANYTIKNYLGHTAYRHARHSQPEAAKLIKFHHINTEQHVDLRKMDDGIFGVGRIDKETALVIAHALTKNTMATLNISGEIDPEGMIAIHDSLKQNTSLIDLKINTMTPECAIELAQIIERNKKSCEDLPSLQERKLPNLHVQQHALVIPISNKSQNQPFESKVAPIEIQSLISKKDLKKILKDSGCKTGPSFFGCGSTPEDSLICLQALLKLRQTTFSYSEIKACIKEDPILKIFLEPEKYNPNHLRSTAYAFRAISSRFTRNYLNMSSAPR